MILRAIILAGFAAGFHGGAPARMASAVESVVVHAALETSSPAAGDTIISQQQLLRLLFSEPIGDEFAVISLTDGSGRLVRLSPRSDPTNGYALVADLPTLSAGGYLVTWRIVSADGHPVGGSFQFYAAPGAAREMAAQILATAPRAPDPPADAREGPAGLTGEPPVLAAILRGAAQIVLLGLAGLLVLPMLGVRSGPGRLKRPQSVAAILAPLLLAADFYLWVQHASPTGQVDAAAVSAAFGTQNGVLYAARAGLAALCAWALLLARAPRLAAAFAAAAIIVSGATGHPAGMAPTLTIPAKVVHLAAASLWTGGLLALVAPGFTASEFREEAWRVSRIALYSVVAIGITGLVVTFRFLPRLQDLYSSAYGLLVVGKLAGLGILVAFGYRNRYRLMPRLEESGPAQLRRSVTWETGLMGAVVVLAAFLAYVSPPRAPAATGHEGHMMPASEEHQ